MKHRPSDTPMVMCPICGRYTYEKDMALHVMDPQRCRK